MAISPSSASLSSRRASTAMSRTCWGVKEEALTGTSGNESSAGEVRRAACRRSNVGRHRESLLLDRPLNQAAADALDAHALGFDGAAHLALERLQVGLEEPLADARGLAADAAEVLGLAAA